MLRLMRGFAPPVVRRKPDDKFADLQESLF
jgi:hypothetical protein